jgi:hypothetical protein
MKQRYFIVVNEELEQYSWIYEEVSRNMDNQYIRLNNPMGRFYDPEVFRMSSVRELTKEQYNSILETYYDDWPGETDRERDELIENIIKKVL